MYWKPSRYPELKLRSASERQRVLTAAINEHGRGLKRRFFVATGTVLCVAFIAGISTRDIGIADWRWWILPLTEGAMFYTYLLWEVNGPLHLAVKKQLANPSESAETP